MRPAWCVFVPLLLAYAPSLLWCMARWNSPTQYYEHCWLLPLVGAYVVWKRADRWRVQPAAVDLKAWGLLAPALLLHLVGAMLIVESLSAFSLALAIPGAAWLALGRSRMQDLWSVAWLSLLLVPTPILVEGWLAFRLKEFAVSAGAWLGNCLGADVARDGAALVLVGQDAFLYVADACGGLRSLMAMLALAYCIAFFVGSDSRLRRLLLLLSAVPIAVGANVVRIAMLCVLARHQGVAFTEATGHTLANLVAWSSSLLLLLLLDKLASRDATAPTSQVPVLATAADYAPALRRQARLLVPLGLLLLLLSWYKPLPGTERRAERLPVTCGNATQVALAPREAVEYARNLPRWRELLGSNDFVWRRYQDAQGALINLVATFHDTNWKSIHAPRICIEGSNMDIETDDVIPAPWLADDANVSRIVARSRSNGVRYVTYSVFGGKDWLTGRYLAFAWHHLPLALLRRNESGFLLRVETAILPGETDSAAAEARCAVFLRDILPPTRMLLP